MISPLSIEYKYLDEIGDFPQKERAGNTFREVPGPEQTDWLGVDMSLNPDATGASRVQYPIQIGVLFAAIVARLQRRAGK